MASCKTNYIQLPGLKMHYASAGEGENTVLLVHGYSSSWRAWKGAMERLPGDFRAIAVDVRGSGDSDKPASGHTIKQMSEDIYQLAQALNLKKFTLAGHSMGGAITMNFAIDHPELLKSMVMVNPAPPDGLMLPAEAKEQFMAILKSKNREGIGQMLRMMAFAPDAQVDDAVMSELVDDAVKVSDAFLEQAMADMGNLKLGDSLSKIDLPALMIHGDRDAAVALSDAVNTFQRICGCSLQVFYGCGHFPQLEAQEDFTRLLISFARNPRRRQETPQQ